MQAQSAEPAAAPITAPAGKVATTTTEAAGSNALGKISLGKLVEESKNPEAERIKKEIDSIRDQRSKLIGRLNEFSAIRQTHFPCIIIRLAALRTFFHLFPP